MDLLCGIRTKAKCYFVLSGCTRLTDEQTEGDRNTTVAR